ncbi:DUF2585 domain-containing protein [Roseovarius aestuarii]|uniref:Uncharacterized protein n=1 Tax=Roseovarius aestuarii TaxID=475083 RepID=A0A1X7BV34_9RHOB|nr:DUF2585 domain-containing protein [Roseovarius aestuarii]SMC13444.1 hypothetical protein ROA7745_03292 [Roseovarius aestuarii]
MSDATFRPYLLTSVLVLATCAILLWMGRVPWCACGYVDLWGTVGTSEGSQQLFDWYTPSHLLHGFIFYAALWLVARRLPVGWRLVIATLVECAWEIAENTNAVIERYREVTISLDYYGDSVLNSFSDIVAMLVGFWLARMLPVWVSFAIVIGFELLTMAIIRDGLALNVIMLLWPLEAIRDWQAAM